MKSVEFLGAASDEVTGSSFLITSDDGKLALVDFGMFQGNEELDKKNYELLAFNPANLQAVFLTHAHLDHSGRLPLLIYGGFFGKIYMTAPTKAFVNIILSDSARIAEKNTLRQPLYTSDQVGKILNMIEVIDYNTEVKVGSFAATFRDAGHILGSSSIEIKDISSEKQDKIVFSGDLGNTPQSIVKPTQYIDKADYVVVESTYGDSSHPDENVEQIVMEEINKVEETGGVLLIPAFAIERTQEILHIIHHLKKDGKVKAETKFFLDSPMGIDATSVYMDFNGYYNEEILSHKDIPFNFEGLVITDAGFESRKIAREQNPKVIIAGSGMMSGGRIIHHAINYLGQEDTRLLFVGYQAEETLGRDILQGAKNVVIDGTPINVKASIREIKTLSSHADLPRLMKWVRNIKDIKKVFITHGEKNQRVFFAEKIKKELGIKEVYLPANNTKIDL